MLLTASVKNWKSFYEETLFSMIATQERTKGARLMRLPSHPRNRVLPVAAMFGPNASGKTSFVQALEALKEIASGDRIDGDALPASPSLTYGENEPTELAAEFLCKLPKQDTDENASEVRVLYEVEFTASLIVREALWIRRSIDYQLVFERTEAGVELEERFARQSQAAQRFISVASDFMPDNVSFLKFAPRLHLPVAIAAYEWFKSELTIIGVNSVYPYLAARVGEDKVFENAMNRELSKADTGIDCVRVKRLPREEIGLSKEELKELTRLLSDGNSVAFVDSSGVPYFASRTDKSGSKPGKDTIAFSELTTVHINSDGEERILRLSEESLGTRRFMTLLPMLAELEDPKSRRVYVVDELENSMHSLLTGRFLEAVINSSSPDSRHQLIFTTHDLTLLEQDLLRRDELWLTEKVDGHSELIRLSDFDSQKIRKGSALLRAYLDGRLGGIPQ